MTVRPIRLYGDPVLRAVAEPVTSFDDEVQALVADLEDSVRLPGRAGVAAPQIGVSVRAFSWNVGGRVGHLINPVLTDFEGTQDDEEEGCLSLPGMEFVTPRAYAVTATGFDQHGEPLTLAATGFLARALQHETDHLDGRLYLDTLTGDTRRRALRELRSGRPSRA
jgi:peptide deformylase